MTCDNCLQVETGLEAHTTVFMIAILTRMRWTVNGGVAVHGHRCARAGLYASDQKTNSSSLDNGK